jgi:hypothetical protein
MNAQALEQASKEDLKTEIIKFKEKQKRLKNKEQESQANVVETGLTLASGIGLAYLQGTKENEVRKLRPEFDSLTVDERAALLADVQGFAGIDYDLLVGIAALGISFTDMAGDTAGSLRAVGTGALVAYGSRLAYDKAAYAVAQEE